VAAASEVRSLLGADRRLLPDSRAFVTRWARGGVDRREVERELRAQIERVSSMGVEPAHLDGHQHLHLLPGIFELVVRLCEELRVPRLRVPRAGSADLPLSMGELGLEVLAWRACWKLRHRDVAACERFLGRRFSCRLDEGALLELLERVGVGTSELMCHPGRRDEAALRDYPWGNNWERELTALTSPRALAKCEALGICLVGHL
jgi:predicted glycoside hydrolase/deacetylase ChbG (UPF0249 family)